MKKVDIVTRMNLTLLAKAYWEKKFPLGKRGQIYYELDRYNEDMPVRYIYFEDTYHDFLLKTIKSAEVTSSIMRGNSPDSWFNLIQALEQYSEVENFEYEKYNIYTPLEEYTSEVQIPPERLENVLSGEKKIIVEDSKVLGLINKDLQQVYIEYDVHVSNMEKGRGISVTIHFKDSTTQRFSFDPIFKILDKYGKNVSNMDFYKGANQNSVWIPIYFE